MISINDLARMVIYIAGSNLSIRNAAGPEGVMGQNSENHLIAEKLGWTTGKSLRERMERTNFWIRDQVASE